MEYNKNLDNKPPISKRMENDILNQGFVTGSKVFGGWVDGKSDIDICIPPIDGFRFDDMFRYGWYDASYYSQHSEFMCVYYKTESGDVLNVLFFNRYEDWTEWKTVTNHFRKMLNASSKLAEAVSKNKIARTNFFETLRETFYGYRYK